MATFDPATVTNGALSNGNLTYTHNGTAVDSGARTTTAIPSGKVYAEVTLTNLIAAGATCISLGDAGATYANQGGGLGSHGASLYLNSGDVWASGSNTGHNLNGGFRVPATGDVIAVLLDATAKTVQFQNLTTGAALNTVTNLTSEASYQLMTLSNSGTNGGAFTINLGASAFVGALPGGYVAWNSGVAPPSTPKPNIIITQ